MTIESLTSIGISIVSMGVSLGAFRLSKAADRRDQEAIILVNQEVYAEPSLFGHKGPSGALEMQRFDGSPYDEQFVISSDPLINDGLTLRPATASDNADGDKENYRTYKKVLVIENVGRATATELTISFKLIGTFLSEAAINVDEGIMTEQRSFAATITIPSLRVDASKRLLVRSMVAIPTALEAQGACCGGQFARLVRTAAIEFFARG